MLASIF